MLLLKNVSAAREILIEEDSEDISLGIQDTGQDMINLSRAACDLWGCWFHRWDSSTSRFFNILKNEYITSPTCWKLSVSLQLTINNNYWNTHDVTGLIHHTLHNSVITFLLFYRGKKKKEKKCSITM